MRIASHRSRKHATLGVAAPAARHGTARHTHTAHAALRCSGLRHGRRVGAARHLEPEPLGRDAVGAGPRRRQVLSAPTPCCMDLCCVSCFAAAAALHAACGLERCSAKVYVRSGGARCPHRGDMLLTACNDAQHSLAHVSIAAQRACAGASRAAVAAMLRPSPICCGTRSSPMPRWCSREPTAAEILSSLVPAHTGRSRASNGLSPAAKSSRAIQAAASLSSMSLAMSPLPPPSLHRRPPASCLNIPHAPALPSIRPHIPSSACSRLHVDARA